jgi:hypothetical protein
MFPLLKFDKRALNFAKSVHTCKKQYRKRLKYYMGNPVDFKKLLQHDCFFAKVGVDTAENRRRHGRKTDTLKAPMAIVGKQGSGAMDCGARYGGVLCPADPAG